MEENKDIFEHIEKRKVELPDASYFENLAESVLDSQKVKVVPFHKRPIAWISAAAAAILVFVVFQFGSSNVEQNDVLAELDSISNEEVFAYVEDNIDDFDIELLAEFVPEDRIDDSALEEEFNHMINTDENSMTQVDSEISFDNISKDDILDYLEEEELDIYELEDDESFI
jgi:Glu-tRNA(Gln) amidotransferase subunit E-like FAD-binding protein